MMRSLPPLTPALLLLLSPQPACVGHGVLTLPSEGAEDGRSGAFGPDDAEPGRDGAGGGDGLDGSDAPGGAIGDAPPAPLRCDSLEAGRRRLRRLTATEFDRSVEAVFGVASDWGGRFAADPVVEGFANDADALVVTPLLVEQVRQAAEALAEEAAPGLANAAGCGQGPECGVRLIANVGRRAYRRPLDPAEVEAYAELFERGSTDGGFVGGVQTVVTAMLQSPHFLYRLEIGEPVPGEPGVFQLSTFEVATELSFLVTGAPPTDALLDAAEAGEVDVASEIGAMLVATDRRAALHSFVARWLDLGRLATAPKDTATYPDFNTDRRSELLRDTERFTDDVLDGEGTLGALLTADAGDGRVGILGLPSFLATHGRPDGPSPIHRGKAVRERILCQLLPPPPPGIDIELPDVDPSQSVRERFAAHATNETCAGCHRLMDPIGHGFNGFDGIGRPIADPGDLTGELLSAGDAEGAFDGPADLARRLAESQDVHDCFAKQWLRFAYGVSADDELSCLLPGVQREFYESGGRIEALLGALVQSTHFKRRVGDHAPPPPAEEAAPGPPGGDEVAATPPEGPEDVEGVISAELADELVDDGVQVEERIDSEWGEGWCQTVIVTNGTGREHTWAVRVEVRGAINNLWNAVGDGDTGDVEFRGVDHNASLAPGATAEFGFCGAR